MVARSGPVTDVAEVAATARMPRRRGRQLDPTRDAEILRAALDLLAEVGYDRLTVDAIAVHAHAGKATLYRRWPSKAELVVDAVRSGTGHGRVRVDPDTGSLEGDLRAMIDSKRRRSGPDDQVLRIMAGLVSALPQHPDLAALVRERLVDPQRAALRAMFERAAARGEIRPGRDVDLLASLIPALTCYRLMIMREPVDPDYLTRIVEDIVLPLIDRNQREEAPDAAR
jgi:AcrR family transcriptional regulator